MNNPTPDQIKQARLKAGLTQTKAAKVVYKSLSYWQAIEYGKRIMQPEDVELFELKTGVIIGTGDSDYCQLGLSSQCFGE